MAQQEDYPQFSGDDVECVKCANKGASTQYLSMGSCMHIDGRTESIGFYKNERLHRRCLRCGFGWDEALAAKKESEH